MKRSHLNHITRSTRRSPRVVPDIKLPRWRIYSRVFSICRTSSLSRFHRAAIRRTLRAAREPTSTDEPYRPTAPVSYGHKCARYAHMQNPSFRAPGVGHQMRFLVKGQRHIIIAGIWKRWIDWHKKYCQYNEINSLRAFSVWIVCLNCEKKDIIPRSRVNEF